MCDKEWTWPATPSTVTPAPEEEDDGLHAHVTEGRWRQAVCRQPPLMKPLQLCGGCGEDAGLHVDVAEVKVDEHVGSDVVIAGLLASNSWIRRRDTVCHRGQDDAERHGDAVGLLAGSLDIV